MRQSLGDATVFNNFHFTTLREETKGDTLNLSFTASREMRKYEDTAPHCAENHGPAPSAEAEG